jgi:hypothetical protein
MPDKKSFSEIEKELIEEIDREDSLNDLSQYDPEVLRELEEEDSFSNQFLANESTSETSIEEENKDSRSFLQKAEDTLQWLSDRAVNKIFGDSKPLEEMSEIGKAVLSGASDFVGGVGGATIAKTVLPRFIPVAGQALTAAQVIGGLSGIKGSKILGESLGTTDDNDLTLLDYGGEFLGPALQGLKGATDYLRLTRSKPQAILDEIKAGKRAVSKAMGPNEGAAWSEYLGTTEAKDLRINLKGEPELIFKAKKYEDVLTEVLEDGTKVPVRHEEAVRRLNDLNKKAAEELESVLKEVEKVGTPTRINTPEDVSDFFLNLDIKAKDPKAADTLIKKFVSKRGLNPKNADNLKMDLGDVFDGDLSKFPVTRQDRLVKEALQKEIENLSSEVFKSGATPDLKVISVLKGLLRKGLNYSPTTVEEAASKKARKILSSHLTDVLEKRIADAAKDIGDPALLERYMRAKNIYGETDALSNILIKRGIPAQLEANARRGKEIIGWGARAKAKAEFPSERGWGDFIRGRALDIDPRGRLEKVLGFVPNAPSRILKGIADSLPVGLASQGFEELSKHPSSLVRPFAQGYEAYLESDNKNLVDTIEEPSLSSIDGQKLPVIIDPPIHSDVVDGKALTPEAQRAVSGAAKEQYQRELSKQYETRQSSNNGRKLPNYAINDLGGYADDGIDERYQLYYQLEGERSLDAYLPPSKTSGVTVYGGIDLGQQDPEVLAKELPKPVFLKIQPYLGKKGRAAEIALSIRPLRLSQDEATALEKVVLGKQRERINSVFREVAGKEIAELPIQAQQVLYSLEHNIYGIEKKMPDFFQAMAKGNISKAYNALRRRVKSETLPGLRNRRLRELQVLGELLPDTPIKQVAENSGVEYLPDGTAKVSYG